MIAILGAGGSIANELSGLLAAQQAPYRLVGRTPKPLPGGETMTADLVDLQQAVRAVAGASTAILVAGLKYDLTVWRDQWPRIMANVIEGCRRAQAKLIFFDNVYMYGLVDGPMTETAPYRPCSAKGQVRAQIATALMEAVESGQIAATIARSADFYGPRARNGVPNVLVFEPLSRKKAASWFVNADVPHSLTYTPDAARALAMLAARESACNQVWHLPTFPNPETGRQLIERAADAFGVAPQLRLVNRPMLAMAGWFNSEARESREMLYQFERPYLFDSSKFAREFGFAGTAYAEGINITAASYGRT